MKTHGSWSGTEYSAFFNRALSRSRSSRACTRRANCNRSLTRSGARG
jgi:hypothetical protein